jgi:hypothetical protein
MELLILSAIQGREKEHFARFPTALRQSRPLQQWVFHFFIERRRN